MTQAFLLAQFEGQTIDFLVQQPQKPNVIVSGKIIRSGTDRSGETQPIIEAGGKLRFDLPGKPLFPKLADDSILKPELDWKISSAQPAKFDAEITYLTGGIDWSADYNVITPEKGDRLQCAGWITIDNQTGKSFENTRVKLIAGDVHKLPPDAAAKSFAPQAREMATAERVIVEEKSLSDYHRYTLPRPATLRDRAAEQIEFVRAADVAFHRLYVFDAEGNEGPRPVYANNGPILDAAWGTGSQEKIGVFCEFKNSEANHLGIPLPKGRWRFYERGDDEQLEFTGENGQAHTPKDETVRILTGAAFDLTAAREQTSFTIDRPKRTIDEAFAIKLRNHKYEAIEIHVVEHLNRWQSWELVDHSDSFTKKDAHTIEFVVRLEPAEEKSVSYRVRYTQLPTS